MIKMKTEAEIRTAGMCALTEALGAVDAERFVALMNRERFDETVASLATKARELRSTEHQEH